MNSKRFYITLKKGMSEFAMALSNPYQNIAGRHPGHVGLPLPSVSVRLVDKEKGSNPVVVIDTPNTPGSLQVKGPTVFSEYLNRPEATKEAFTPDGYFDTGDDAEYNDKLNSYRILGRASVDILKVGGHKISAIELERELLEHPNLLEVVVVGVPDDIWGQRVGLIARSSDDVGLTLEQIQKWCESKLAQHKTPTRLLLIDEIPKNAMGKVNKKELVNLFESNRE